MRRTTLLLPLVALAACSNLGPEDPLVVRGVAQSEGVAVEGVRVTLNRLAGIFNPGGAVVSDVTDAGGRFELVFSGPCGTYFFVAAEKRGYTHVGVSGFDGNTAPCPGTVEGVLVRMEPLPPLAITTTVLPAAILTIPYWEQLHAEGGDDTYTWSLTGGTLPAGLVFDAGGVISGTPTAPGTSTFTVGVESGDGQVGEGEVSLTVADGVVLQPTESCVAHPDSAIVTFGDRIVQGAVRAALGSPPSEPLTCGTVATLAALRLAPDVLPNFHHVESLAGLQNLTGLDELVLWSTAIGDLGPLAGLSSLAVLEAAVVEVDDVTPLGSLDGLRHLSISSSRLRDLAPLGSLVGLRSLGLDLYAIADLAALAPLTELDSLAAPSAGISDISGLSGMTGMVSLDLRGNAIADLAALSAMTPLQTLDLASNQVADATPLGGLTELRWLDLSGNDVSDLTPLAGSTGLSVLDLSGNRVVDVAPLGGLAALDTLRATGNSILTIAPLASLAGLAYLDLDENSIEDMSPVMGMTGLETLRMARNAITTAAVLDAHPRVTDLDLSFNALVDLSGLRELESVRWLGLWGNAGLSDIQPLLQNAGLGAGDIVTVGETSVSCADVTALRAKGVQVASDCS